MRCSHRHPRSLRMFSLGLLCLVMAAACNRSHYRRQADQEVYCLVDNVSARTGEAPPDFSIDISQQSRMFDPNSPDFPPMPPDDPEAHSYMHCVDCKRGWPCWHRNGDTPYVANPYWLNYLPRDENGDLVLDQRGAVDVALVNSSDFQEQLEELYLSALDVTFERFRLDTQFYGGSSIFYTADGAQRPGGGGESSSSLNVSPFDPGNRLRATRLFAGGGELVVGLANSLVWEFSGPNSHSVNTLLDFSFVQPLLRAGGRARVLERLTIAERTLLANVRQMERYRRGFYAQVVTGRNAGAGPSRRGGFFGGAGLEGFSGVGGGGFGRVGTSGGIGSTNTGAGAAGAGGYLGLLQSLQEIRNQEANVAALRVSLAQLRAFADAGRLGNRAEVQIGLAASALYNAESRLLTSKAQFQSSLDAFKMTLGLPPSLPVRVDDHQLDQFNLIDPELVAIQQRVEQTLDATRRIEFAKVEREDLPPGGAGPAPAAPGAAGAPPGKQEEVAAPAAEVDVERLVQSAARLRKEIEGHLRTVDSDLKKLESVAQSRRRELNRLSQREEVRQQDIDANLLDAKRFDGRLDALKEDYQSLIQRFDCDWKTIDLLAHAHAAGEDLSRLAIPCRERQLPLLDPDAPVEDAPEPGDELKPREIPDPFRDEPGARDRTPWTTVLTELSRDLLELTLVQARMRANSVTLIRIDLTSEQALRIASQNRRDWANARSELVNAWRLIEFNANDLQSGLDLTFSGDVGNVGKNPLNLDASTGRLRVGVRFDAPLTRLAERNVYRQSLIEYQQARRNYYTLVDRIDRGLRETLRTIQLNDLNFELRREAVQVALRRYHFTILDLDRPANRTAPAGPGQLAEGGEDFGATTARDLVDALSDLQNAQNDFLSVWVNYEVQRLSLDFDLGTMQLDAYGQWIDPGSDVGREEAPIARPGGHGDYAISETEGNDGLGFFIPVCGPKAKCRDGEEMTDLELLQLPEIIELRDEAAEVEMNALPSAIKTGGKDRVDAARNPQLENTPRALQKALGQETAAQGSAAQRTSNEGATNPNSTVLKTATPATNRQPPSSDLPATFEQDFVPPSILNPPPVTFEPKPAIETKPAVEEESDPYETTSSEVEEATRRMNNIRSLYVRNPEALRAGWVNTPVEEVVNSPRLALPEIDPALIQTEPRPVRPPRGASTARTTSSGSETRPWQSNRAGVSSQRSNDFSASGHVSGIRVEEHANLKTWFERSVLGLKQNESAIEQASYESARLGSVQVGELSSDRNAQTPRIVPMRQGAHDSHREFTGTASSAQDRLPDTFRQAENFSQSQESSQAGSMSVREYSRQTNAPRTTSYPRPANDARAANYPRRTPLRPASSRYVAPTGGYPARSANPPVAAARPTTSSASALSAEEPAISSPESNLRNEPTSAGLKSTEGWRPARPNP